MKQDVIGEDGPGFVEYRFQGRRRMIDFDHIREVIETEDGKAVFVIVLSIGTNGILELDTDEQYDDVRALLEASAHIARVKRGKLEPVK